MKLSLLLQFLIVLLAIANAAVTATSGTKESSISSRYSPNNIPFPPVPASWPQRADFVGLVAEDVIAKVHSHVDDLHNDYPAFRSKNTRAQPSYVKDLLYIEMLAQQGVLLQGAKSPTTTEVRTSSFLSLSSRSLLGSRLHASAASKNKFGFVKKAYHHVKAAVAPLVKQVDRHLDTFVATARAVDMVVEQVNPCRKFDQQYTAQLNIKASNQQKIEELEEREITAQAQKERLQTSAHSVQEHCKCNPASAKCLIGSQVEHEIVLLEHEGEQIEVEIKQAQDNIHAVDNVNGGAIQRLKAANPECSSIQDFYDWVSAIGAKVTKIWDNIKLLVQVVVCISIEINICILGAAIDAAVMTSFPAVLAIQTTPFCLFIAGETEGGLFGGANNEALHSVAFGVEQGIAANFHLSDRAGNLDSINYHTTELGAALVEGDPTAIVVRLFFFAVFGMKKLGQFLDDNAIGGIDDTMREISEKIATERWVAEFVVSVLLDGVCAKFGSAISTILAALAECNLCGVIDCRGNCPTADLAFVDACKDDGTSAEEDSDEWILVHGGNGRQSYQPLYNDAGNFAPTTSELLACTNEGLDVEHPSKENVAPSEEKWIAPCATTCNDDPRCNEIWLEESGRCCTYRSHHGDDKMNKGVHGKYFIRVADPALRDTSERVTAATLIDLNTPAECPTVFCTSDFAGKNSASAIADEKQHDKVGDCTETPLASFNDKRCLGGVCKVMTVEGCKQICQSHSECSIFSYSSNIDYGGCKLYSDTCTADVPDSDVTLPSSCTFPFSYKGVSYTKCTNVDTETAGYQWCSHSSVYTSGALDETWSKCTEETVVQAATLGHWTISHVPMDKCCPAHLPKCTSRGHCIIPGSSTTSAVVALPPSNFEHRVAAAAAAAVASPVPLLAAATTTGITGQDTMTSAPLQDAAADAAADAAPDAALDAPPDAAPDAAPAAALDVATCHALRKVGHECNSADTQIGTGMTLQQCSEKCRVTLGCRFFVLGTGNKDGQCYYEKTNSAACEEGWEVDQYNFYENLQGSVCTTGSVEGPISFGQATSTSESHPSWIVRINRLDWDIFLSTLNSLNSLSLSTLSQLSQLSRES